MNKPNLSLMMTRYDRTDPLFSGEVTIAGADLKVCPPPVQGDACYKPVYEQFDIAEMSLSWYLMARCRGEPLIALRIFPLRMFIQPYLFCREPSAIRGPEDLAGKRVGIQQYRIIVGLWTRGILKERHGVDYSTIQWVVHERLFAKCPWISRQLVDAFNQADRCCQIDYEYPKRLSFPTAVLFLEEEEKRFGKNPWAHGLEPNRAVLNKFVEYAHDQGYISFRPTLDDVFAPLAN